MQFEVKPLATITIINPEINRGSPPRQIQLRDLVQWPVKDIRPKFNFGDMLSDDSIRNLITVYNALTAPERKRKKALKAPHKA